MLISRELARRLELAEARDAYDTALASGAEAIWAGGGVTAVFGASSPLTQSVGVGMQGPVSTEDLSQIEAFLRVRGCEVLLDVCPYADVSLWGLARDRGYRLMEFKNVMVRELPAGDADREIAGISIRIPDAAEHHAYAEIVGRGFFGRDELNEDEIRITTTMLAHFTGFMAGIDGQAAGCGALSIRDGVATLAGDGTLIRFRGRGVQSALILARLRHAATLGCDIATAGVLPGSGSQRNYERLGFQVAYTKIGMGLKSC